MVPAPGQCTQSKMVLSYSGKPPHMVTPTKKGGFTCDCPSWKSMSICSHTIAVAENLMNLYNFCIRRKGYPMSQIW